jgi:hypothetical protein
MNAVIDEILRVKLFSEFKSSTAEDFSNACFAIALFCSAKSSQRADPRRAMGLDRLLLRFGLFSKLDSYRLPFVLVHSDYYLSFSMSFIEVTKSFRSGKTASK